jgi:hypothetical protein
MALRSLPTWRAVQLICPAFAQLAPAKISKEWANGRKPQNPGATQPDNRSPKIFRQDRHREKRQEAHGAADPPKFIGIEGRNHSKKMRPDDERNHWNQILFASAPIEKDDCDHDENNFQYHKNPVNLAVESASRRGSHFDMSRREKNAGRDQNRNQEKQPAPRCGKIACSGSNPQNGKPSDYDGADRIH